MLVPKYSKGNIEMAKLFQPRKYARRAGWLRGILGMAVAVVSWGVVSPATAGPAVCGPGAHWIDSPVCPGGIDVFPLTNGVHTVEIFGLGVVTLLTTGPTTIWRGPGTTVPDHHIDTELVSLTLVGGGLTLVAGDGIANGSCDGPLCSLGRITETTPLLADSFFDVFFEIQGTPFGPLHNDPTAPCKMKTVLDQVPPPIGTTYICDTVAVPIFLFDATGLIRGQLLGASHIINTRHQHPMSEPATLVLLGSGLTIALWVRRRRAERE